jgi:cell division protein FtsI/penicillin-binding protein 2
MKRAEKDRTRTRTLILGFACLLWFTLLILRLVQIQVLEHGRHKQVVEKQNQLIVNILPERGGIFDRSGTILATNIPARNIAYQPEDINAETRAAFQARMNRLRSLLPRPYAPTRQDDRRVWDRVRTGYTYSYIVRQVPQKQAEKVAAARIPGIVLERTHRREYPQDTLFGRLVGWTNVDGKGQSGVELSYDRILGGQAGQQLDLRDAHQRKFQAMVLKKPVPGKDVYLTVDETIQHIALRSLRKMVNNTGAAAGLVVISNPSNGEILAMAEVPGYNPNLSHTANTSVGQSDHLLAIRSNLEHGSTMKIATFAAAIEYNLPVQKQTFDCREGKRLFGRRYITDHKKLGILPFPDVFIHSSNVGTTMIADGLAHSEQYRMLETLGFGRPTGIDLPAEEKGIFPTFDAWDIEKYKYAYVSIGYGISSTPLQVLQMTNIVANRGIVIPFRVVRDIPQAPQAKPAAAAPYKRALSQSTADELSRLMQDVVEKGTGVLAAVPGFSAAGKTGTARKLIDGSYSRQHHIGSFVGFAPAEDPRLSMIVVIDDPQGVYYGGDVAAPVFRDIAVQVLRRLRVPKSAVPSRTLLTADQGRNTP